MAIRSGRKKGGDSLDRSGSSPTRSKRTQSGPPKKPYQPHVRTERQMRNLQGSSRMRSAQRGKSTSRLRRSIPAVALTFFVGLSGLAAYEGFIAKQSGDKAQKLTSVLYNPGFKTRYQDLGKQIIQSWYSNGQVPSGVNVSSNVIWPNLGGSANDGSGSSSAPNPVANITFAGGKDTQLTNANASGWGMPAPSPVMEALTYNVVYNNVPTQITVTLGIPDITNTSATAEAVLLTSPTITPLSTPTSTPSILAQPPKSSNKSISLSSAAQAQLTSWATAWASNDTTTLKTLSLDTDPTHYYQGIGGWTFNGPITVSWAMQSYGTGSGDKPNGPVIAEITFPMSQSLNAPEGTQPSSTSTSGPSAYTNVQTMDVMLSNYNSGLPSVVSWGPQGSWATLKPYSVAIISKSGAPTQNVPSAANAGAGDDSSTSTSVAPVTQNSKPKPKPSSAANAQSTSAAQAPKKTSTDKK